MNKENTPPYKANMTPAYAYKNRSTGLLEISNKPPPLSIVADEDDSVVRLENESSTIERSPKLALYPIRLGGGGTGLYSDPREFGRVDRGNLKFGKEVVDLEAQESSDEIQQQQQPLHSWKKRRSSSSRLSNLDPWSLWTTLHTELSRLAAIRTTRLEDNSSHATLLRQKHHLTSHRSGRRYDDDFDFVLVLSLNEAYAFWARYLDFREEALGCVEDPGGEDESTIASLEREEWNTTTPNASSGLRRRRTNASSEKKTSSSILQAASTPLTPYSNNASPAIPRSRKQQLSSQKRYHQKSLFERAVDKFSPPRFSLGGSPKPSCANTPSRSPDREPYSTGGGKMRRRWGNHQEQGEVNLTSPPIRSFKSRARGGASLSARKTWTSCTSGKKSVRRGTAAAAAAAAVRSSLFESGGERGSKRGRETMLDGGVGEEEDSFFASPGIPRGVAARVNGLDQFLEALEIGIVVRRHWPRGKSVFIQLYSDDKGDTICYRYLPDDDAVIALREQEQRYNARRRKKKARLSFGVNEHRRDDDHSAKVDASVPLPDYLKAKIDRDEDNRKRGGIKNTITHNALTWLNTGVIEAKDIVQVHPATHVDPFAADGSKLGTASLRQSETKYVKNNAFSIILPSARGAFVQKHFPSMDLNEKWNIGEHQSLFRSIDIELATEGEYWMVLRGFLLLHRDASTGRFSAQRAGGYGSYHRHAVDGEENDKIPPPIKVRFTEALPPDDSPSLLNKIANRLIHRNSAETDQKIVPYTGIPPPSDYFLGFSSPGTQIWGRLRQAGLETQRIYALDTKKVMIKVRCPVDRLQDVAEALKLKLKTKDGDYAPYREDLITHFEPTNDGQVHCDEDDARVASLFRSSDRQKIIDFVIGSRIRDSGAELGPSSQLGKQIKARVPLHSHSRLEALYGCWVTFWREGNWNARDGKSLRVEPETPRSEKSEEEEPDPNKAVSFAYFQQQKNLPNILYRFFVGSFFQPLDSIEEYYGEKIAFYFAWLQHVSFHLLYLSIIGSIVFWIQLSSGQWDHPIRPWFSILVVIWSFIVVVSWRKRSNFLAYKWGTLDYKEEEIARPEFKGTEYRVSPITNTYELYYPPYKRWLMMCISIPLTIGFTCLALVGILIFYGNRDVMLANYFSSEDQSFEFEFSAGAIGQTAPILAVELTPEHLSDPDFWLIIIGFPTLLGIILPLLNFCLRRVSIWLNEIENHRTEAEYRTHFIIKVFAFRFVCYFAALYYYSFIGVNEDDPQATEHGILRVASTLFTYITIAHWWNICINVFFPLVLYRWRIYRERRQLKKQLRSLELEEIEEFSSSRLNRLTTEERAERKKQLLNKRILLEHASIGLWEEIILPEHDSFTEYLFAVTQFAYVCCFSVVLPITPVIVLINHLVNMRLDAFKLCRGRRRPLAVQTGGIGVWNHVLHIVTVIAILTNCALMALTTSQLSWLATKIGKLGVFALSIGVEHFMLLVKYIMQLSVSRLPSSVENEIKKKKYDQECKRYKSLRMKKRSKSSFGTKNLGNENDDANKSGETLRTSPFPPINESSTHSSEERAEVLTSRLEKPPKSASTERNPSELDNTSVNGKKMREVVNPNDEAEIFLLKRQTENNMLSVTKRSGLVNVRRLAQHSPEQDGIQLQISKPEDTGKTSRAKYSREHRTRNLNRNENADPNFDPANQNTSGNSHFLQNSQFNLLKTSNKKAESQLNQQSATKVERPLSSLYIDTCSSIETHSSKTWRPSENAFSPDSSISTMPTPRNLRLESEDEDVSPMPTRHGSYYQYASAPPMSPEYVDLTEDDDAPKAKWAVYHSFQYNKSAQKNMGNKKSH